MYGIVTGGRVRLGGCVSSWRDLWRLVVAWVVVG